MKKLSMLHQTLPPTLWFEALYIDFGIKQLRYDLGYLIFYQVKKAFGKWSNTFPEAIKGFNNKYEEIIRSFKDAWGPILFTASILNPKLHHLSYMSVEEWESGMQW